MLRITIELVPFGVEARKREIGKIDIWNDATGGRGTGNYGWRVYKRGLPGRLWKSGSVRRFPRLRLTAYDLLYRVLRDAVGERNKETGDASDAM